MTTLYLCAGVYAEGPTDYRFLPPLLTRLLQKLATPLFQGCEVAETKGIDAPPGTDGGRAERIAAAIDAHWNECTFFVIHSDGAGDADRALQQGVMPGIDAARAARPDDSLAVAACIPVREIEAWMLADPGVFEHLFGKAAPPCPAAPERELDPKQTLRRMLKESGTRRRVEQLYDFFGERVSIERLYALPAFTRFADELTCAIQEAAEQQGVRR